MANLCLTTLAALTVLLAAHEVTAKRGCSAFGHSCFGGHGKRSGDAMPSEEALSRRQSGQEETPPQPGYPRSDFAQLAVSDDIIPVRDGGLYEHEDNALKELMKYRLRNLVKHWMDNYRRNQQGSEDGYFLENI